MAEKAYADDPQLTALLFLGRVEHRWSEMGPEVVFDLFPTGKEEEIQRRCSGLDEESRIYVYSVHSVANAIRSVGQYDFKNDFDEKLRFVRALQPQVFVLFQKNLLTAKLKQQLAVKKHLEEMGKLQPTQSSEPAGEP